MVHEVAADLVGAVGEVVGHQQQARRADAVGGEDHHVGRLEVARPGAPVDVDRPGEAAVLAALEALDAGLRAQVDARLQRLRPDRERELAHRAARAAGNAARAAVAGGAPVVVLRDDARRDRPPVPAEPVERAGQPAADRAQRQRRRRVAIVRRHRRIAGEPAHADDPVDAIVIGCEVLVGDRPVGREAVLDALAEVGWPIARPECRVDVGRAADRVPHQDVRGRALDRIVVAAVADIVVRMPALLPLPFPVGAEVRVIVGRGPAALLEADHLEPRLAQHHARERAAGARADHQHVGGLSHGRLPENRAWRGRRAAPRRCARRRRGRGAACRSQARTGRRRSRSGSGRRVVGEAHGADRLVHGRALVVGQVDDVADQQEVVRPLALDAGQHRGAAVAIQPGERAAGRGQGLDEGMHRSVTAHQGPAVGELGLHADLGGRRKRLVARHQHVDQCRELRRQRLRLALHEPSTSLILTARPSFRDFTVASIIAVAIRPSWPLASGALSAAMQSAK